MKLKNLLIATSAVALNIAGIARDGTNHNPADSNALST